MLECWSRELLRVNLLLSVMSNRSLSLNWFEAKREGRKRREEEEEGKKRKKKLLVVEN